MLIAVVAVFIVFVMVVALIMFMFVNRTPAGPAKKKETSVLVKNAEPASTGRQIAEIIGIEMVAPGVFYADGKYLGLARIEGTNFSVLSDGEQDAREEALIGIQNQINYPVQYITGTVVTDTDAIAREVRAINAGVENERQVTYNNLYAAELEEMKRTRQAMTQVSWLVVSDDGSAGDDPVIRIRERMALLRESFRARVGIILTPLEQTGEVVDAVQQIMLPEKLSRPSDMLALGGLSPVKFNIREINKLTYLGAKDR